MATIEVLVPTTNDGIGVSAADTVKLEQMRKIWQEAEKARLKRVHDIARGVARQDVRVTQIHGDSFSTIYEIQCSDTSAPAIVAEFRRRDLTCGPPKIMCDFGLEGRITTEELERRLFLPEGGQVAQ